MTAYTDFQNYNYTTSGAFSLALTRSQIATLALCVGGLPSMSAAAGSLARKGLIRRLTKADQQAQALRCPCHGGDDMCPCQNAPDFQTRMKRLSAELGDAE